MSESHVEPQASAAVSSSRPSYAGAIGWLLYPIAFFLRLRTVDGVFNPFGTFPLATDSFHHLRRIRLTAMNFPHVPDFDRYVNFPTGAATHWPFGFDFIYAGIALATCPGPLDDGWIVAVACLLTPLIGALTPCIVYRVGLMYGGIRTALYAGLIVAAAEAVIVLTSVGYVDHHVFESFWTAVALWLWLPVLKDGDVTGRRAARAVFSGMAVGAGLICATTLPLLIPLFTGMFALFLWHARNDRKRLTALAFAGGLHWTGTALFLVPFVAARLAEPTGVNPALGLVWLAAMGLAALCLGATHELGRRSGESIGGARWWLAVWAGLALLALPRLAFREVADFTIYGLGHIVASDPWLATISESQPVFRSPLKSIFSGYTGLFFLFPLFLGWWAVRFRAAAPERLALTGLAGATFGLALLQWKFAGVFIVPFALLSAAAWEEMTVRLAERWDERTTRLALTAIFLALLLPGIHWRVTYVVLPGNVFVNLYPTLQWMEARTPRTTPRGDAPTDYGVVADWNVGHWVVWYTGRPVVSSPLGHTPPMRIGIRDGAAMLASPPDTAVALMNARRMRYVLIAPLLLDDTLGNANWDERTGRARPLPPDPGAALSRSLYAFLLLGDAVPGEHPEGAALRGFRLVHEDRLKVTYDGVSGRYPAAKVFEYVAGARLRGQVAPGEAVSIAARIRTDAGREFDYLDIVKADEKGNFECRLPYAQGKQAFSDVSAVTPYRVTIRGREFRVVANEQDVLQGRPARQEQ